MAVLAILTFTFTSCNEAYKTNPQQEEEEEEEANKIDAPENIISLEEANDIFENYTKHMVSTIENHETLERPTEETFKAARFVSYDLKTIKVKDYITFVEQESKKAGVTPNTLGFYFANYPDENKFPRGEKVVHKKQNSIFILPTLNEKSQDYLCYIGEDGKAKFIEDWKAEKSSGSEKSRSKSEASLLPTFNYLIYSSQSLVLNRGGSGPLPFRDF